MELQEKLTSGLNLRFSSAFLVDGRSGVMEAKTKFEAAALDVGWTGRTDLVKEAMADKSFSLRRRNDPLRTATGLVDLAPAA